MPKLNQVVNNLNRPITDEEIEMVRKGLPIKKVQDKVDSQHNSTKLFIDKFLKLLKKEKYTYSQTLSMNLVLFQRPN